MGSEGETPRGERLSGLTREAGRGQGSMEAAWALEEHEQRGGTITVLS